MEEREGGREGGRREREGGRGEREGGKEGGGREGRKGIRKSYGCGF